MPGTDAVGAAQVASAVLEVVQALLFSAGRAIDVDASIGVAAVPKHAQDADRLTLAA